MMFTKEGRKFKTGTTKSGDPYLVYLGKVGDFEQFMRWVCDSEEEVQDMIDAVIDPDRYPEDEYRERHREEWMKEAGLI